MNEEITIYVPVYNGEKTIKKCLDSIFDQTIKPTKILIINDNSDDGTLDILKSYKENIPSEKLNIIFCKNCKLVQLDRSFDPNYLYGDGYGYRTGINKTMTDHVNYTVKQITKIVKLNRYDCVLDIASNDGTLLNFYKSNIVKVGIDPLVNKYKKYYENINHKISNFFNISDIKKLRLKKKI